MTGLAPEPVGRAIARILAGGLDDWRDITDTAAAPWEHATGHTWQGPRGNHREQRADESTEPSRQ